jgi:hypothetical protein
VAARRGTGAAAAVSAGFSAGVFGPSQAARTVRARTAARADLVIEGFVMSRSLGVFKRTIGHAGEGVKPKLFHFYLTARQSLRRGNPIKVKKFRFDP